MASIKKFFGKIGWRELLKYGAKSVGVTAVIFLCLFLVIRYNFYLDVFIALVSSIIVITITLYLFKFLIRIDNYLENKRLSKPYKGSRKLSLYRWAEGIEVEERLFYKELTDICQEDPLKNLNTIKKE
ncbi:hypothetical protein CEW92_03825 [Bacillaceae bacterium SAS-127]|nr:hypothetical protein CEW92_03825 [Bacillaceae bacterium SAS-127]